MFDEIISAARRSPGIEFESSLRLQVGTQIHISASYLNLARIFVVAVSSGASRHEQIEVNSKEATNMEGSLKHFFSRCQNPRIDHHNLGSPNHRKSKPGLTFSTRGFCDLVSTLRPLLQASCVTRPNQLRPVFLNRRRLPYIGLRRFRIAADGCR